MKTKLKSMLAVALCAVGLTAFAEAHTHTDADGNTVTFIPIADLAALKELFANGGSGYLTTDIDADATLSVAKDVNLCLNDKVLNLKQKGRIGAGADFGLYDCGNTKRYYDKDDSGLWTLKASGESEYFTVGGVITGGKDTNGGGVLVSSGCSFSMYGGNISGNTSGSKGGGVFVNGGTFKMEGGKICGNMATDYGGGVYVISGTFKMEGGVITENTATYGGGMQINGGGKCYFTAAAGKTVSISGNTAKNAEAGVANWGELHLSGKVIVKDNICTATYDDGMNYPVNLATKNPLHIDGDLTGSEIYLTHTSSSSDKHDTGVLTDGCSKYAANVFSYDGPYVMVKNAAGELGVPAVVAVVEVALPTTTGYGFVVSNLTAGAEAEIQPTVAGGTTYKLPVGEKVGIYAVPEKGYVVTGEPYIIDEVKTDTTIDPSKLPGAEKGKTEVSAVSAAAELDLTPGDRVARDEETLVVNPAWGGVKTATVQIDGEPKKRTYDCASNDLWTAKALEPGRYGMELEAGTHPGAAGFWKVGADWIVLEGSNFAADVTLEGGRTYLVFGTNTIGGTLTAAADSLFLYDEGAPAGFKGEIAELPKMYRLDEVDGLKRIIAKTPGCEDNPWKVGKDGTEVVAWTNGSELVVGGKGTVDALASIKGWGGIASGIGAVKVTDASVTNVAAGAFTGIAGAKVTLPDGWRGEFPDEGDWYGATDIEMASWPLTVQGVKFLQRYPWNGKVDIDVDVTGTGLVKLSVSATIDGKPVTAKTVEGGEVDCGESGSRVKGVRLTWNALADLEPGFKSEHVRIKVTVVKAE